MTRPSSRIHNRRKSGPQITFYMRCRGKHIKCSEFNDADYLYVNSMLHTFVLELINCISQYVVIHVLVICVRCLGETLKTVSVFIPQVGSQKCLIFKSYIHALYDMCTNSTQLLICPVPRLSFNIAQEKLPEG
jgi:hypothetical protein